MREIRIQAPNSSCLKNSSGDTALPITIKAVFIRLAVGFGVMPCLKNGLPIIFLFLNGAA